MQLHLTMMVMAAAILAITTTTLVSSTVNIRVAILDWSTVDGSDTIWDGWFTQGVSAQFILAANHFNNRRIDLIPDLAKVVSCNKRLDPVMFCESAGNPRRAVDDILWMLKTFDVHALAGFGGVDDAVAGSPLLEAWNNIPAVSHWTSADQMNNKNVYPYFARTIPADQAHAQMLASLTLQLNFKQVGLLWLVDGKDMGAELTTMLQNQGQQGHYFEFLYGDPYGDPPSPNTIDEAVRGIAELKLNVIICATWALQLPQIADAAEKYGLLTDANMWIFTYLDRNPLPEEFAVNKNLTRLMHGSFRVGIVQDSVNWQNYLTNFPTFSNMRDDINTLFPPHGTKNSTEKCANRALNYSLAPDYFSASTAALGNEVWGYSYDAMMSFGMAACALDPTGPTVPSGADLYNAMMNSVDFAGLSGNRVKYINTTGDRDPITAGFKITNWVAATNLLSAKQVVVGVFDPIKQTFSIDNTVTWKSSKTGLTNVPVFVTAPYEDRDYLPDWAKILGYVEVGISQTWLLTCFIWVIIFQKNPVVVNSQPALLLLVAVGCSVAAWTILSLSVDDNPADVNSHNVNAACQASPVVFVFGMMTALVALIAKTWRVGKLFNNKKLRRMTIRTQQVLGGVAVIVGSLVIVLIIWIIVAPLTWQRTVFIYDVNGFPLSSSGTCTGGNGSLAFVGVVFAMYAFALIGAALASYMVRYAPSEYQESRYVALILSSILQIYLVAIPSAVATYSTVTGRFILLSTIAFITVMFVSIGLFFPKMYRLATNMDLWQSEATDTTMPHGHTPYVGGGARSPHKGGNNNTPVSPSTAHISGQALKHQSVPHGAGSAVVVATSSSTPNVVDGHQNGKPSSGELTTAESVTGHGG